MATAGTTTRIDVPEGIAPRIRVGTASGRVRVIAEARASIEVSASRAPRQALRMDDDGVLDLTHAFGSSAVLDIRCPRGSGALIGTASGKVSVAGDLDRVRVTTVSGAIEVEGARAVELRAVSGRVQVRGRTELARISTRSGRVEVEEVTIAEIATASGRITVERVFGDVRAQSVSGTIDLGTDGKASVEARSVSGSINVHLPRGTRPRILAQGRRRGPVFAGEEGNDCTCRLRSMSGKIAVEAE